MWYYDNIKLTFSTPPVHILTGKISIRKKTDADVPASYTVLSLSTTINIDGTIPGFVVSGLEDALTYVLKIDINDCDSFYFDISKTMTTAAPTTPAPTTAPATTTINTSCNVNFTSIDAVVTGSNVAITFAYTGSAGYFKYRIDNSGGGYPIISGSPFTIFNVANGVHTITLYAMSGPIGSVCDEISIGFNVTDTTTAPASTTAAATTTACVGSPSCPEVTQVLYTTGTPGQNTFVYFKPEPCADQYKILVLFESNDGFLTSVGPGTPDLILFDLARGEYFYPLDIPVGVEVKIIVTAFKNGTETSGCSAYLYTAG